MKPISRRSFIEMALALGATAAWGSPFAKPSKIAWRERRDIYPEGVASGDPESDSVLLWTRRPPVGTDVAEKLNVEIAEDGFFERVVAAVEAPISEASDWTCRVLVGGLKPSRVYWYRFTDRQGHGSRVGRTITAPAENDARPVRFAFVSCQNANDGAQNAYRRMIFEDARAPEQDRLGFVLHLGDFIYEIVWYPEDRPQGMYDRRIRDIVRYQHGEKIEDFHIPTDGRRLPRGLSRLSARSGSAGCPRALAIRLYVGQPRIQLAGLAGPAEIRRRDAPAQTRKVAANQAFFEYQPARMFKPSGPSLEPVRSAASRRCADHAI